MLFKGQLYCNNEVSLSCLLEVPLSEETTASINKILLYIFLIPLQSTAIPGIMILSRVVTNTNLPIFKLKESCVRRRYSDFEWLKNELERDSKIVVPPLPGKALKRQLPFRGDEGIFEESFIEERRQGLEQFINKIAGHPLAQNERCLHMFLQEEAIDRNYVPGKKQLNFSLEAGRQRLTKIFEYSSYTQGKSKSSHSKDGLATL
uniref:Sorting nexin 12 n=1 Tax=Bos indicus x Bos taurus TaxID=30522 RepID=A0A4W2IQ17_BOBOX